MSSKAQKPSKLPKSKLTSTDHSYTKFVTRQSQRGKNKPSYENENDDSSDESVLIEDSAPCHGCQKAINKGGNGVCCNFCEHWYCLTCSKLKKVVYQALKESPDSLMWFCTSCLTSFPGVKKMMIKVTSLEEKYDQLDERVTKIEEQPNTVENIEELVRQEVREIKDIEARKMHMVCFNLPESLHVDPDVRKMDDEENLKAIIDNDMKLSEKQIEVENLIRLGKRPEEGPDGIETQDKHRPLRFKVKAFESKREILQANSVLKNLNDEVKKKIFMTPDLTRKQREKSFKLREELRYRKNVMNETNLKISKGRIVNSGQGQGKDSTRPSEDGSGSRTAYRHRTFVNSSIAGGSREGLSQNGRPFLEKQ